MSCMRVGVDCFVGVGEGEILKRLICVIDFDLCEMVMIMRRSLVS